MTAHDVGDDRATPSRMDARGQIVTAAPPPRICWWRREGGYDCPHVADTPAGIGTGA